MGPVFSREEKLPGHMLVHGCVTGLGSQEASGVIWCLIESLRTGGACGDDQTPSKGLRTICFQNLSRYLGLVTPRFFSSLDLFAEL